MTTLNWLILFILSAMLGTLVTNILNDIMQSTWIPRICGALVAALVSLGLYIFFFSKK